MIKKLHELQDIGVKGMEEEEEEDSILRSRATERRLPWGGRAQSYIYSTIVGYLYTHTH